MKTKLEKVKLDCFYPYEALNDFSDDDVFRYFHFARMGKQVTIINNRYGFALRCCGFAPSFYKTRNPVNTWYQVTPYFKSLKDVLFLFDLIVSEIIFGRKLNFGQVLVDSNWFLNASDIYYCDISDDVSEVF